MAEIDLRRFLNAISDVVNNRPRPLREFDQIFMKSGDMLLQADYLSKVFDKMTVAFIGDGDAIGVSLVHLLHASELLNRGPKRVHVFDFDERVLNSISGYAKSHHMAGFLTCELYNVADPLPKNRIGTFDAFYTNPPFGKSNTGRSVRAFAQRGTEAIRSDGIGCIVMADDPKETWTQDALLNVQRHLIGDGYVVSELIPSMHEYHLDDAPGLKSCNLLVKGVGVKKKKPKSLPLDPSSLVDFYGRGSNLRVAYVRAEQTKKPEGYRLEMRK